MIKKRYDFRQVTIPEALLQAEVTKDELASQLHQTAQRFTVIAAVSGPVQLGDVVALEFADDKQPGGLRRIYANVGKDFDDLEALLPGLQVGDRLPIRYAGREVQAHVVSVKRPCVPELTDGQVGQLGIAGVETVAQLEDHLFAQLAEGQRKRKFRGIMGIVSKAIMEKTEFTELEESHPWYQALYGYMMGRVEALAAQQGVTADEALPMALRMEDKSLEECRRALKAMVTERVRQGALGQAYAQENGVRIAEEGDVYGLIGNCVDYLNQTVYDYFAPQIQVTRA